jgi:hypothetical protein
VTGGYKCRGLLLEGGDWAQLKVGLSGAEYSEGSDASQSSAFPVILIIVSPSASSLPTCEFRCLLEHSSSSLIVRCYLFAVVCKSYNKDELRIQ